MQRANRLASRQHGAISLSQALTCGLSHEQVRGLVVSGRWRRPIRGVFVVVGAPTTWRQTTMVACLAGPPSTAASHLTSAALLVHRVPTPLPHVTVPPGASPRMGIARVHRSPLTPADVVRIDSIPCTKGARMLVECAALLPESRLAELVDDVLCAGLATPADVEAAMSRASRRPGRAGMVRLRNSLAVWTDGIGAESPQEARLIRRLVEWGFDRPKTQIQVARPDGGDAFIDCGWVGPRVGLEHKGRRAHGPRRMALDEAREAALRARGWTIREVDRTDLLPGATGLRRWLEYQFNREACA
jgi:hypothetical protein